MADELSQAVSFVNGYCTLADGLVVGFENYLADDVILDWFGHAIEGRANVSAFLKHQKSNTKHMLTEINPVTTIGYGKLQSRRKYHSIGSTHENGNMMNIKNYESHSNVGYKRKYYSDVTARINSMSCSPDDNEEMEFDVTPGVENDLDLGRIQLNPVDSSRVKEVVSKRARYDFSDCSECFQQSDMKTTDVGAIVKKITELSEKRPQNHIESKVEQVDCLLFNETNSIKYVEAAGVIEFYKFSHTKQIRKEIRKRYSRLQMAYSVKDANYNSLPMEKDENRMDLDQPKDYEVDERNRFLACLELQINDKDGNINNLVTPKCPKQQFIASGRTPDGLRDCTNFSFNYIIHLIIYESNSKCRLNLSQEFEENDVPEDTKDIN